MHALAKRLSNGAREGKVRTFAVGAGHMHNRGQSSLGMPEPREQALDASERQVDRLRVQLLQPLEQRLARRGPVAGLSTPETMR